MTRRRIASRLGWLLLQLFVVFVGVFAAFLLDDYRERRRAEHRAEQILLMLRPQYAAAAENLARNDSALTAAVDTFWARHERGERPPIERFNIYGGFDAGTWQAVLQAGGLEVLDVETIGVIDGLHRGVASALDGMADFERLSDALVAPYLEEGPEVFYDPTTERLRPTYAWYPEALRFAANQMGGLHRSADSALAAIDAELVRLGVEPLDEQ